MTCIVGIKDEDGTVYIGGDSLAGSGWTYRPLYHRKVFQLCANGVTMLVGVTGSPRTQQLIQYHLEPPAVDEYVNSPMEYMVRQLVPAVRDLLKEHGLARVDSNEESHDSEFLIGFQGELFEVETNYNVIQPAEECTAIGSGMEYALGAINALASNGWASPRELIEQALETAGHFNVSVGPPYYVEAISWT